MLIEYESLECWLDRAVSGIRFKPDRLAVRAELYAHLEDRTLDLLRIFPDIAPDEARDRALAGMGDPGEVGAQLAKVHKPWLGWLWYACRGLLILSVLAWVLAAGLPALMDGGSGRDPGYYDTWYYGVQPDEWSPPGPVRVGDLTLEVTRAARWEERFRDDGGRGKIVMECESAAMTLRVTAPWPWERPPATNIGLEAQMRAVDSAGREFSFVSDHHANPFDNQPIQGVRSGLCWQEYELYMRDITPGARWIELRYDFGGRSFALRADIPEKVHYSHGDIWYGEGELS